MEEGSKFNLQKYLSNMKKLKADKLLIILLAGVLLLIICIPTKSSNTVSSNTSAIFDLEETLNSETGSITDTEDVGMVSDSALETQLEEILQKIDGVGQVEVMITSNSEYNQIEGVVVVAEGADVPQVRQEIIETAQALFPIAAYKVKVCKMAGGQI